MKLIGCWLFCDNKLTGMLMICEAPVDDGSRNCCILLCVRVRECECECE